MQMRHGRRCGMSVAAAEGGMECRRSGAEGVECRMKEAEGRECNGGATERKYMDLSSVKQESIRPKELYSRDNQQ